MQNPFDTTAHTLEVDVLSHAASVIERGHPLELELCATPGHRRCDVELDPGPGRHRRRQPDDPAVPDAPAGRDRQPALNESP